MIKSSFVPKGGYELDCDPFDASLYTTVRKHIRLMAGKFYTILSDEDIEDLTHDAYLRVMENRDKADYMNQMADYSYSADRPLNCREFETRFWGGIEKLTPEYRDVAMMLLDEIPYCEMAKALGCSEETLRVRICRARKALHRMGIAA